MGLFNLERIRLREDLINLYKNLKGESKKVRDRLFSVMSSASTGSNGHKLVHRISEHQDPLNIRKHFLPVRVTEQ